MPPAEFQLPNVGPVPTAAREKALTVSQVTALIKRAIETTLPTTLHVIGQISNFKRHSSGHLYFTLKDAGSELACILWRSAAELLKFRPEDGMEVIATGHVEVFERAGRYQLYIRKLEPRGVGALELAFRQLCEKLSKEGLFDARRKRPLPRYPQRIAIVTSPTGAAIADILRTLGRRYPCIDVLLFAVRVQGHGAAGEIASAIRKISENAGALGGIDVMIVGRGGGSLEDLWAFNEEIVARAIHASTIPVVSAVGHEVDVSIADLVADVRAATPTAAAELVVPVLAEVLADLAGREGRVARATNGRLAVADAKWNGLVQRAVFREPLEIVFRRGQWLDELSSRMHAAVVRALHTRRRHVERLEPTLQRIAPHAALLQNARRLHSIERRLHRAAHRRLSDLDQAVTRKTQRIERSSPVLRVKKAALFVDAVEARLPIALQHRLTFLAEKVRGQVDRLTALSYKSVLHRGFSITRLKRGDRLLRDAGQLRDGDRVITQLSEGEFESQVIDRKQFELFDQ